MTEAFIRHHADAVLQICTYYLGKGESSERAFVEVFYRVGDECGRAELFRCAREVCLKEKRVSITPDCEEWLYEEFLGLDRDQAEYVLRENNDRRDVSKLSILRNV